jgi:carbamoyl-phosphate synthase large subunit
MKIPFSAFSLQKAPLMIDRGYNDNDKNSVDGRAMTMSVLVTGVGGTAGQSVISAIRMMREKTRIVGVDMNPFSAGLYVVDKGYVVPSADDRSFIPRLIDICAEENIKVLIPTVDEELLPVALSRSSFEKYGATAILASSHVLEKALDKWETYVLLHAAGIPVPKSMLLADHDAIVKSLGLPLIIKPRKGRGGRNIVRLDDQNLFGYFVPRIQDPIFQECLTGTEYTVDVVVSRKGKILAIVPKKRIEMRGGSTYKAITVREREIENTAIRIAHLLKADGPLNIQFMVNTRTGQANVLEINPRFSSSLALTVRAGVNSVEILIRDALGKTVDQILPFREGLCMLRYWQDVVLPRSELLGEFT